MSVYRKQLSISFTLLSLILSLSLSAGEIPSLWTLAAAKIHTLFKERARQISNKAPDTTSLLSNETVSAISSSPYFNTRILQALLEQTDLPWKEACLKTTEKFLERSDAAPYISKLTFSESGMLFADDDKNGSTWAWNPETKELTDAWQRETPIKIARPRAPLHPAVGETIDRFGYRLSTDISQEHNGYRIIETLRIKNNGAEMATWQLPYDETRKVLQNARCTALHFREYKDNIYIYIGTETGELYSWKAPFEKAPTKMKIGRSKASTHGAPLKSIISTPNKHLLTISAKSIRRVNISPTKQEPPRVKPMKKNRIYRHALSDATKTLAVGGIHNDLMFIDTELKKERHVELNHFMSTMQFSPRGTRLTVGTMHGDVSLFDAPACTIHTVSEFLDALIEHDTVSSRKTERTEYVNENQEEIPRSSVAKKQRSLTPIPFPDFD